MRIDDQSAIQIRNSNLLDVASVTFRLALGGFAAGPIVRRDLQVGKYFVAVADRPVDAAAAAVDLADVVEIDFARVFVVGDVQFDADQIALVGIEIEARFDAAWLPTRQSASLSSVGQGSVPR